MLEGLNWPGGEHDFALKIGELRALQDRCDAGPEEILHRFGLGTWRVDDIWHVLQLGLIGGGTDKSEAKRLVENAFESTYPLNLKPTCSAVLGAALVGPPDDDLSDGDDEDQDQGEATGPASAPANGASQASTATDR